MMTETWMPSRGVCKTGCNGGLGVAGCEAGVFGEGEAYGEH